MPESVNVNVNAPQPSPGGSEPPPPDPYAAYRGDYARCSARIADLEWRRDFGLDENGMEEAKLIIQREIDALKKIKAELE